MDPKQSVNVSLYMFYVAKNTKASWKHLLTMTEIGVWPIYGTITILYGENGPMLSM